MYKAKVLHIIDTLGMGGAEKLVVGVVNSLSEFEHHVVYLNGSTDLIGELPTSCKVFSLGFRNKKDIFTCAFKLRHYIKNNNIFIVHSHLCLSTFIARIACPKDVQLFTTIHSLPSRNYFAKSKLGRLAEKLTYNKRHHLITVSNEVYKDYDKCIGVKGPHDVLYNFVDDKYLANDYKARAHNKNIRLVAVGKLKSAKNYHYLLEAFKKMPSNVQLDIYGDGPLKDSLQKEIDTFNLNIRLCGPRGDMHNILPAYDAFVMSSSYEGFGLALAEAMASGVPPILSDIPIFHEISAGNAVYFDLQNPGDLANKLQQIVNNEIDLRHFAIANFERVREIADKEIYMGKLKRIYLNYFPSLADGKFTTAKHISFAPKVRTALPA